MAGEHEGDHDHDHEREHDEAHAKNVEEVFVYELADPALNAEGATLLQRALFEVLGVSDPARHTVAVSASSGWITYYDREGVWRPEPSTSLPTAAQARAKGDAFVRSFLVALERHRADLPPAIQNIGWMPQARPVEIVAVPRPDGIAFDHWLYRLIPRLPASRGRARWVSLAP